MTRRRKIVYSICGALLVALIVFRLMLPSILLRYVNRQLTLIKGYSGHVDDIDVALIRGAYTIKGIRLDKTDGKVPVPFFSANAIDLSVEWGALFHGSVAAEIEVQHPILNFAKGPTEATSQTKIDKSWTEVVDHLIPFKLNRFEIFNGEIHYRDFYSSPKVDIFTKNVHILAENLSNARHQKELLPSPIEATADVYGGKATLHMKMDALNKAPTFEAKAELVGLELSNLNPFLQAYGNFDVKQGDISIYTEAAARDYAIKGYTKPIIKDLKVINWQEDKDHPLKLAYKAVISAVTWVFKNHSKDQLATRAEFEGNLKDPDINVWYIVGQLLRNAFIQALYPSLENSINIGTVGDGKEPTKMEKAYKASGGKPLTKKEKREQKKEKKREEKKKKEEQKKKEKENKAKT
ncbi:MAG: DUF748 domain-containing protein [Bacteroidetes bacterium]|nr:DUF748 domain-containing protein [Bacteroidota bacterium]